MLFSPLITVQNLKARWRNVKCLSWSIWTYLIFEKEKKKIPESFDVLLSHKALQCLNTYQCDQSQLLFVFLCFCEICRTDLLRAGLTTAACCALEERGEKCWRINIWAERLHIPFVNCLVMQKGRKEKWGGWAERFYQSMADTGYLLWCWFVRSEKCRY